MSTKTRGTARLTTHHYYYLLSFGSSLLLEINQLTTQSDISILYIYSRIYIRMYVYVYIYTRMHDVCIEGAQ